MEEIPRLDGALPEMPSGSATGVVVALEPPHALDAGLGTSLGRGIVICLG